MKEIRGALVNFGEDGKNQTYNKSFDKQNL
jgi:hypothetical protein